MGKNSNSSRTQFIVIGLVFFLYFAFGLWHRTIKPWLRPVTPIHEVIAQATPFIQSTEKTSASELKGRILLIHFFSSSCASCRVLEPKLKEFQELFGDKIGIIGVHSPKLEEEKNPNFVQKVIESREMNFPIVHDSNWAIMKKLGVNAWPTWVVVNPDGQVELSVTGVDNHKIVKNRIFEVQNNYLDYKMGEIDLEKKTLVSKSTSPLKFPSKMTFVSSYQGGRAIFVSDTNHHRILGLRLNGEIVFVAGKENVSGFKDGSTKDALFSSPRGIAYYNQKLFVADTQNHRLREIDLTSNTVKTVLGDGMGVFSYVDPKIAPQKTSIAYPWDVTWQKSINQLQISFLGHKDLLKYNVKRNEVSKVESNASPYPIAAEMAGSGNSLYFLNSETHSLSRVNSKNLLVLVGGKKRGAGFRDGNIRRALMQYPSGITSHSSGIYIADTFNHAIRRYDLKTKRLETILSRNPESKEFLESPVDVEMIDDKLYILNQFKSSISVFDPLKKKFAELNLKFK